MRPVPAPPGQPGPGTVDNHSSFSYLEDHTLEYLSCKSAFNIVNESPDVIVSCDTLVSQTTPLIRAARD